MATKIGVDVGGSWIRVGVLKDDGSLHVDKYPSPGGWEAFTAILSRYRSTNATGVGVAIAGPVENHAVVLKGPNLHWLDGRDVATDLGHVLGVKVVVSNDMEAATEGEMARGVLRNYRWAIFDTISTGWGGNLVLDGRRVDGEPGHVNVRFDPHFPCGCGNIGCNEAFFSGSHMERCIRENLPAGADVWAAFEADTIMEIPWAIALLDEWSEGVGRAWANVLNRIRPIQAIVYMGTTAKSLIAMPRVAQRLRATLQRIAMFPEHKAAEFPILRAEEPNRAIYGAIEVYEKMSRDQVHV